MTFTFPFYFSLWDLGLNLGLHACKADTLPLEAHLNPFCSYYFGVGGGSHELFVQAGFEPQFSWLSLPNS
jgi:hypothetical protein